MHFEFYTEDEKENASQNAKTTETEKDQRLPLTPEVDDFFASIYLPESYGYGKIFKDYKNQYALKDRNTVRNAIERSRNRNKKTV